VYLAAAVAETTVGGDPWTQPLAQYGLAGILIGMCIYAITWLIKDRRRSDVEHKAELAAKDSLIASKDAEIARLNEDAKSTAREMVPVLHDVVRALEDNRADARRRHAD